MGRVIMKKHAKKTIRPKNKGGRSRAFKEGIRLMSIERSTCLKAEGHQDWLKITYHE